MIHHRPCFLSSILESSQAQIPLVMDEVQKWRKLYIFASSWEITLNFLLLELMNIINMELSLCTNSMKYSHFPDQLSHRFIFLHQVSASLRQPLLPSRDSIETMGIDNRNKDAYWSHSPSSPSTGPEKSLFPLLLDSYPQLVLGLFHLLFYERPILTSLLESIIILMETYWLQIYFIYCQQILR